jgi:hypothetical protein
MHERSPSHARRQRRYRARQRRGERVVVTSFSVDEVAKLQALGTIDADKVEDAGAIATAIHLLIASIHED